MIMKKIILSIILPCLICFLVSILFISSIFKFIGFSLNFTQYISYFILYLLIDIVFLLQIFKYYSDIIDSIKKEHYEYLKYKLGKMKKELSFCYLIVILIAMFMFLYKDFAILFIPIALIILSVTTTFYLCCKRLAQ